MWKALLALSITAALMTACGDSTIQGFENPKPTPGRGGTGSPGPSGNPAGAQLPGSDSRDRDLGGATRDSGVRGPDAASRALDAERQDPEETRDAGFRRDAGGGGGDGGGQGRMDGGRLDAGRLDAGRVDGGRLDAGRVDGGRVDAGRVDGGRVDAGRADAGRAGRDSGAGTEAGLRDTGHGGGGRHRDAGALGVDGAAFAEPSAEEEEVEPEPSS